MIGAQGRDLIRPVVSVTASEAGVTIRVDDDARPEFWFQVFITADDLKMLAAHVDQWELIADLAEQLVKLETPKTPPASG